MCCVGSNYKTVIVPCKMGEVWVNWGRNDLAADFPELFGSVAERNDLSWTHKGEVQGIEEKHNIFPCSKGKENTWDILLWDNAWMVIIGSFILAFSCVNECLFNRPLWDHRWEENTIKSFCTKHVTQVELYLYSLTASGPQTVRLASPLWPQSLGPSFQFELCLQPFSVQADYRKREQFCII